MKITYKKNGVEKSKTGIPAHLFLKTLEKDPGHYEIPEQWEVFKIKDVDFYSKNVGFYGGNKTTMFSLENCKFKNAEPQNVRIVGLGIIKLKGLSSKEETKIETLLNQYVDVELIPNGNINFWIKGSSKTHLCGNGEKNHILLDFNENVVIESVKNASLSLYNCMEEIIIRNSDILLTNNWYRKISLINSILRVENLALNKEITLQNSQIISSEDSIELSDGTYLKEREKEYLVLCDTLPESLKTNTEYHLLNRNAKNQKSIIRRDRRIALCAVSSILKGIADNIETTKLDELNSELTYQKDEHIKECSSRIRLLEKEIKELRKEIGRTQNEKENIKAAAKDYMTNVSLKKVIK